MGNGKTKCAVRCVSIMAIQLHKKGLNIFGFIQIKSSIGKFWKFQNIKLKVIYFNACLKDIKHSMV